jgi:hypothetical protein
MLTVKHTQKRTPRSRALNRLLLLEEEEEELAAAVFVALVRKRLEKWRGVEDILFEEFKEKRGNFHDDGK